ncbi:hypothetical protein [Streptomyces sp. NBC_01217]|uniref:hypothetical protein n=1 Tax=Streptomyces sp. NBC_01217 TaxID=2903779 RepID=UPI002E140E1C|nr:hypothetical protein OG507_16930 [Streptomyces sp. NBC_01217]
MTSVMSWGASVVVSIDPDDWVNAEALGDWLREEAPWRRQPDQLTSAARWFARR